MQQLRTETQTAFVHFEDDAQSTLKPNDGNQAAGYLFIYLSLLSLSQTLVGAK